MLLFVVVVDYFPSIRKWILLPSFLISTKTFGRKLAACCCCWNVRLNDNTGNKQRRQVMYLLISLSLYSLFHFNFFWYYSYYDYYYYYICLYIFYLFLIFLFFYYCLLLLYRHECFAGKYTTRKIHKNYIRDPSGLFSIISHVSLSMT